VTRELPPHAVHRSPDGDGITERGEARCGLRVSGTGRGLPDEAPDEPCHLSLNADRVFREDEAPGAPERSHVMPCARG